MNWKSFVCCFSSDDIDYRLKQCEQGLDFHDLFFGKSTKPRTKQTPKSKIQMLDDRVKDCERRLFEHDLKLILYQRVLAQQDTYLDDQAHTISIQEQRINELDELLHKYIKLNKPSENIPNQSYKDFYYPTLKKRCLN